MYGHVRVLFTAADVQEVLEGSEACEAAIGETVRSNVSVFPSDGTEMLLAGRMPVPGQRREMGSTRNRGAEVTIVKIGDRKLFVKSGATVEIVDKAEPYMGQKTWRVKRVDNGKELIVTEDGLVENVS